MTKLTKDDFYCNIAQEDWIVAMDIEWAYKHYAHMDTEQLKEYWQKQDSYRCIFVKYREYW